MAARYWVGGSATWDATAGTKWATTSGGAGGAAVPTAADDVFLDGASGAVTVSTSSTGDVCVCRSLTCTGFSGSLTLSSVVSGNGIRIGDASGGALTLSSGMTITGTATIAFVSTSTNGGAGWPITSAGKSTPPLNFAGSGGKWTLQDAANTGSNNFNLTLGTLASNGFNITCNNLNTSFTGVRTLDITNSTVTCTGTGNAFNAATSTNLTVVATGSTIIISGASATFQGGTSLSYGSVSFTGSGSAALSATTGITLVNLTRTGTAVKTDIMQFVVPTTITGTLTLNGNSAVNRLLVQSNTTGASRTITAATVVVTNVDFMDISGAGAGNWNLSAITGGSGDCGGNSGITFTTPATQTHTTSAGGNWSDVTKWTSRVPLPQDNVIVDGNTTGTLSIDMPRMGADITLTGFAGSLSTTAVAALFGSLTLSSGMTPAGSNTITLSGRGSHTITSVGKTVAWAITQQGPGGTYTLQDALSTSSGLQINDGTFTTNNNSVTCSTFSAASGRNCTLNLGSSTITLTSTATTSVIQFQDTHTTVNGASTAFVISTASTLTRTIALQGTTTLGTVTYTVASSPGALLFNLGSSACTVTTLNVGPGRQLSLFAARTLTFGNINANGVNQGYLYLPGVTGNYASAPDSAALSITGDIDIRVKVAMDRWTPAATAPLVVKSTGSPNFSYRFLLLTAGTLFFTVSVNGTAYFATTATSTAATGVADGAVKWVRVTWRASDGRTQFFTGDDGATWTQLGANVTMNAVSIFDGASPVEIGSDFGAGTTAAGKFYRAQIRNNVLDNGTGIQFDAKLDQKLVGANTFTESSTNAATVTINGALAQVGDGRVAITSSTPGSAATLSYAGPQRLNLVNVTLQDITATGGAAGYFVYTQSGGNVSGNTGWTFGNLRTISDAGGNWSSTATWMEGAVPLATDHVVARSTSGNAVVDTAGAVCRSLDLTGYAATLSGTGTLTIGDANGGSAVLGGTISGTWAFVFVSTSTNGGVGAPIFWTGHSVNQNVTFNGVGGKWTLQDAFNLSTGGLITLTNGILSTNGQTVTANAISTNNTNVRTFDITNSTVNLSGAGNAMNASTATGLTVVATGSTVNLSGAGALMNGWGVSSWNTVNFTGSGAQRISMSNNGSLTFVNLNRTGTAAKTDSLQIDVPPLGAVVAVTGTLTLGGNTTQGVNRLLVQSTTPGTQRVITLTGATIVQTGDVDFMDMALSNYTSWTNTGSAFIGDCGGNGPNIVANRTTPATQTWNGTSGGNWSANAWSGRVPLPQDNVVIASAFSASQTIVMDMPRAGKDIDFTGTTGSPAVTRGGSVNPQVYGSWTLVSAVGSLDSVGGGGLVFAGRGTHTMTSAGKSWSGGMTFQGPNGSYTLQDALTLGTGNGLIINDGTWNTNNNSVTCGLFIANTGRATTLNLGTSTISLTSTSTAAVFRTDAGATTVNGASSTIVVATAATTVRTFNFASGQSFGTITYTVANSPGVLQLVPGGSGTTLSTLNVGSGRTVTMFSGRTLTVTNFNVNGTANGYLYLPGVSGNLINTPDSAALSITGDIDMYACVAPDAWGTSLNGNGPSIITKDDATVNREWQFRWNQTTKKLEWLWWDAGGTLHQLTSSAAIPTADGAQVWLRVTFSPATGAANFYTSADGVTWTPLGTTQTFGATTMRDLAASVAVGSGYGLWTGKLYRAVIKSGIDGTVVFDADFTNRNVGTNNWLDAAKTQFTESSANAATVTINGSLAQVGDGRVVVNSSTPGSRSTVVGSPKAARTSQYLSVKDIQFEYFHALNSADAGNNNGVAFKVPPPKDAFLMAV